MSSRQSGFTIIELLIATAISSMVMLILIAGILQFSKQYYKGVIASSTQGAARTLVDDLARAIQFNGGTVASLTSVSPLSGGYCIGSSKMYSFRLNRQVRDAAPFGSNQGFHGLVSNGVTGCNAGTAPLDMATLPGNLKTITPALSNPRELLGQNMRLTKFSIVSVGNLYNITVRIVYGDDNLLCSPSTANDCANKTSLAGVNGNKPDLTCRGSIGSEYCAVSELSTTVMKRVN